MKLGGGKTLALAIGWSLSSVSSISAAQYVVSVSQSNGAVVLSWAAEYIGCQLQYTSDFGVPHTWTDMPGTLATNRISVPVATASRFFRLATNSIPTLGLVARYDFNGDTKDAVGGHHGTNYGATLTSNRFGIANSAYAFNGTNAYIEIPDSDDFSISTTRKFSISVWVRPDVLTFTDSEGGSNQNDYVYWMGKGHTYGITGNQEWACRMYNFFNSEMPNRTNRISFYVFSPAGGRGPGSYVEEPVTPGAWIHFVATVNDTTNGDITNRIIWYKNGDQKDSDALRDTTYNAMPQNGSAPVRIGTMNFDSFFKGAIDNLLFYDRVLSPAEIKQLYNDQTR